MRPPPPPIVLVGRRTDDRDAGTSELHRSDHLDMVRLAHLLTGSETVAEGIVRDAFAEVHRRWSRLPDPAAALRRSVVDRSHTYLRQPRRRRSST